MGKKCFKDSDVKLMFLSFDGEKLDVCYENGEVVFNYLFEILGVINGYYEFEVSVDIKVNG